MNSKARPPRFELILDGDRVTLRLAGWEVASLCPSEARLVADQMGPLAQVLGQWAEVELRERSMTGPHGDDTP